MARYPVDRLNVPSVVKHQGLVDWVARLAALAQPDEVQWADGRQAAYARRCGQMVASGTLRRLNPGMRPHPYLAWPDPSAVARVEDSTFTSSAKRSDDGPTNTWA